MGVGPGILSLYSRMQRDGLFTDIRRVMELGNQTLYCNNYPQALADVFNAFDVAPTDAQETRRLSNGQPIKFLFERLGIEYFCIDVDSSDVALRLDLNFDACPDNHRGQYQFVTNHGTTEHLLNQYNSFRVMHDLAATGALMLHALPFLSYVDHGYFNYQPNLFIDIARANDYELLGIWVNVDPNLASLIPWEKGLHLHLRTDNSDILLVVLMRKRHDIEFCVPLQAQYEDSATDQTINRYNYVVDGTLLNGRRGLFESLDHEINRFVAEREILYPPLKNYRARLLASELLDRIRCRIRRTLRLKDR